MTAVETPLMQQWRDVKARHPDALVFFRVGDFYELFNEDAVEGARLLDLTLTSRNNGSSRAPLAGVPVQALDGYLRRLVSAGHRVAICEQVEDPAQAKGLVRREVTELVTPGTVYAEPLLDARRNNFIVALAGDAAEQGEIALAAADLSTGELVLRAARWPQLSDALVRFDPAELLLPRSWEMFPIPGAGSATRTYRPDALFETQASRAEVLARYRVATAEGFGIGAADALLVCACGALLAYLADVQPSAAEALRPPRIERADGAVLLDEMTRRNLEICEPSRADAPRDATLLGVLDETLTPMGARLLRAWLLAPLLDVGAIARRLDAVEALVADDGARRTVRQVLSGIRDLERLAVKAAASRATPRDLLALAQSLAAVPPLREALGDVAGASLVAEHRDGLDPLPELRTEIDRALADDAPAQTAEGGFIRDGYDAELDALRATRDDAVGWIARLQARERERTGIGSLKVGFNRVFGYYLEVTHANAARVPPDYQRKQTLTNAERFYTAELKDWEEKVLGAEDRIREVETQLLVELRTRAAAEVARVQRLAEHVAALDVLAALAEAAVRREFARPVVHDGFDLEIRGGRHPVVEATMRREAFIPNDVVLTEAARVMVLTGPNMAGKSTVLRQVGLIAVLAQVGSFVPAASARIGCVDRIFTRVGASDNLTRGQSTFMLEMTETAAILHGATARSLVLLDEIGRGTATWDGLSVATATTEYLHDVIGAKTIFATHYHEMTRLAERMAGVVNWSVAVREVGEEIVFLRRLVPGGADRSYGVEVARLAGLPPAVVARARAVLADLEAAAAPPALTRAADVQLSMFEAAPHPVLRRLSEIDPERVTPIEALLLLSELAGAARA